MYSTRASRWMRASPSEVYRSLLDPFAVAAWRVPNGMSATIHTFDPRVGGRFRISLHSVVPGEPGRSVERTDTFSGSFTRLVPDELVVESLEFETTDPLLAGVITVTTELQEADGGCEVLMVQEGIPEAIDPADSDAAIQMTMVRLAAWVEEDLRW